MAKKVQIGDVVEFSTKKGKAYAQFTHYHEVPPRFGALLRVLPGFWQERPKEFRPIVNQNESFYTFFPLQAAVNRRIVEIVGHEDVPPSAKKFPIFRAGNTNPKTGKVEQWWLWDGSKSWKVDKLTDEQLDLPIRSFPNDTLLIRRIEEGWTPRKAEAFVQAARLRDRIQETRGVRGVKHFLLFDNERAAKQANRLVAVDGFESELIDDGRGFTLTVTQPAPFAEEYIENVAVRLTEIAREAEGTYDAWEIAL